MSCAYCIIFLNISQYGYYTFNKCFLFWTRQQAQKYPLPMKVKGINLIYWIQYTFQRMPEQSL